MTTSCLLTFTFKAFGSTYHYPERLTETKGFVYVTEQFIVKGPAQVTTVMLEVKTMNLLLEVLYSLVYHHVTSLIMFSVSI